ncbi:MAG: DUF4190 domain-containing protein [Clostridia bacterium]|nr:DUF4190 domain-containing protein [Clostridia bacterium]
MYICTKCNQTYSTPAKFCSQCGGEVVEHASAPEPEFKEYSAPSYSAPVYADTLEPKRSKAPAIMGMIFGIWALICAFVMLICMIATSIGSEVADEVDSRSISVSTVESLTYDEDYSYNGYHDYDDYDYDYDYDDYDDINMSADEAVDTVGNVFMVVFSILILPFLIIGLILSFIAKNGRGMALAGKITGFIAVAVYAIAFIIYLGL